MTLSSLLTQPHFVLMIFHSFYVFCETQMRC